MSHSLSAVSVMMWFLHSAGRGCSLVSTFSSCLLCVDLPAVSFIYRSHGIDTSVLMHPLLEPEPQEPGVALTRELLWYSGEHD